MPMVEESIYNKRDQTLTTHTRNVAWLNEIQLEERSVYSPVKVRNISHLRRRTDNLIGIATGFSGEP